MANLEQADLSKANLEQADLSKACLKGWTCSGASLRFADFRSSKGLTTRSVMSAFGVRSGIGRTVLPDRIVPPEHWHVAAGDEDDSTEAQRAYELAYRAWRAKRAGKG